MNYPSYLCIGGTEVVNEARTRAYLRNCLGDSSWQFLDDCDCPPLAAHVVVGGCALVLDGTAGTNASTPDKESLRITGDIDIRAAVALDDWTPATINTIVGRWPAGATNNSFYFRVNTNGRLALVWSPDGTSASAIVVESTVAPTISDGEPLIPRVGLDVDNGAGGRDIRFYTKPFPGDPFSDTGWTQLGSTITQSGTTSIHPGDGAMLIGNRQGSTFHLAGKVFSVAVKDGIDGTLVVSPDFTAQAPGTTTFTDPEGNVWTLNGNAEIACSAYGSPASDPAPWYSAQNAASEKFFGFIPERIEASVPTARRSTARLDEGSVLGPEQLLSRSYSFRGWLVAADEEGMRWGMRWMQEVLRGRICAPGCEGDDGELLISCADPTYFRSLVGVGLIDGPRYDVAVPDNHASVAVPTQFQIESTSPYLFHDGQVIADALPIPSPSEETWDDPDVDWDDPNTPWDGTIIVGPYHCLLIDTPDWFDGSTLELSLSAPAGAVSDVRITMAVSLDGTCDEQAQVCFDITIPHLPQESRLVIDGRRRNVTFFDPTRRVTSTGYSRIAWQGAFPWPDLSACSQVCLCIDNSVSAPFPVEVTVVQYRREL